MLGFLFCWPELLLSTFFAASTARAFCFRIGFGHVLAFFGFAKVLGAFAVIHVAVDPYFTCSVSSRFSSFFLFSSVFLVASALVASALGVSALGVFSSKSWQSHCTGSHQQNSSKDFFIGHLKKECIRSISYGVILIRLCICAV